MFQSFPPQVWDFPSVTHLQWPWWTPISVRRRLWLMELRCLEEALECSCFPLWLSTLLTCIPAWLEASQFNASWHETNWFEIIGLNAEGLEPGQTDYRTRPDPQLLHEGVSSKAPGFSIKQSRERRNTECRLFPGLLDKYSFLSSPDFLLLAVSFLFLAFGCSVPVVYLVPYALSVDISHHRAVLLLSILGVMGIVGNITFGWISDRKWVKI